MKVTHNPKFSEDSISTFMNSLCQGFEGESFYGLEYVLDDYLENSKEKSLAPKPVGFDWFGLNG
jgi:hypothetical protein